MKGSEILVKILEEENVKHLFGIPGDHNLAVYDALKNSPIKVIVPTHEPAVGFMADVYGRITGNPGVALLIAGPGVLNTVNAVAQAYVESSPMIVIATQCDSTQWGKGLYHELKHPDAQMNIFKDITKWQTRVKKADEIPEKISKAINIAMSDRKGPTYVEIPKDIFLQESAYKRPHKTEPQLKRAEQSKVRNAVDILLKAKSPLIYAGGGAKASNASKEILKLAEWLDIPVTTTLMGKGVIPEDHPLFLGCGAGMIGNKPAVNMFLNSDAMLAIGTRFDEVGTGFFTIKVPKNLIHLDIDKGEINRNYPAKVELVGDAKTVLKQILDELSRRHINKRKGLIEKDIKKIREEELAELKEEIKEGGKLVDPLSLVSAVGNLLSKKGAVVIADAGNSLLWALEYPVSKSHSIFMPAGYNSMGFAVPGAISAKLASPSKTVLGICGDGSFLMTGMEFATAIKYNLDINVIVLHDNKYNILELFQDLHYNGRHTGTSLQTFNFADFANMLGGLGIEIKNQDEIEKKLKKGLAYKGPTLFDVYIDPKKLPPISKRLIKLLA